MVSERRYHAGQESENMFKTAGVELDYQMMNSKNIKKKFTPTAVGQGRKDVRSGGATALIRYFWIIAIQIELPQII